MGNQGPDIVMPLQINRAETNQSAIGKMLADGKEASDFIGTYVVQGRLNERGNYCARPPSWSFPLSLPSNPPPFSALSPSLPLLPSIPFPPSSSPATGP